MKLLTAILLSIISFALLNLQASEPKWIWINNNPKPNEEVTFSKTFSVQGTINKATISVFCANSVEIYINDKRINDKPEKSFEMVIDKFLKQGVNKIRFEAKGAPRVAALAFALQVNCKTVLISDESLNAVPKETGKPAQTVISTLIKDSPLKRLGRYGRGEVVGKRFKLDNIPDLTKGGSIDDTHDWRLGPIGANGWVYCKSTAKGASRDARQIFITRVDKDGPAHGKLKVNDVILGVDGRNFSRDARKALAAAINESEKEKNKGELSLRVWRNGKRLDITLTLKVLGSYSATAPYNCPKTEKIIEMASDYLKERYSKEPLKEGWNSYLFALGMMATGDKELMPIVKKFAHLICVPGEKLSVEKHVGMVSWKWAYKTLFLTEYYLLTGDKSVLPTIEEYATKIAMGQSGAGTWGHTYAARENTGSLHGHLGGYGALNQIGLTLLKSLVLAEKCGIKNDEISQAIDRGRNFFAYFIDKGAIPYGDHGAQNEWFDDNGKTAEAAILFDLLGDNKGAEFFGKMVVASAPSGREEGHCGCFWMHLWGGMGARRSGKKGLSSFMKVMDWAFTLERNPNGRMSYQKNAGDIDKQRDLKGDCTAVRLLQLCIPLKQLYITGKETPDSELSQKRIDQLLRVGRLTWDKEVRSKMKITEIMQLLKDPLPVVRSLGAKAVGERERDYTDDLMNMLKSKNRFERYGAIEALGKVYCKKEEIAHKVIELMEKDRDVTFRSYAIKSFTNLDRRQRLDNQRGLLPFGKPAIPVLLKIATQYSPDDPRKVLQNDIGFGLCYTGGAQARRGLIAHYGLDGVDRSLFIPFIRELLKNENGGVRGNVARVFYPILNDSEKQQLWGDIYKASRYNAPSNIMFSASIRTHGLKFMTDNRIKEGLELAVWYIRNTKGHGRGHGVDKTLGYILQYGSHAKKFIPELEKYAKYYETKRHPRLKPGKDDKTNMIRATIKKLEAMPDKPDFELVSIKSKIKNKEDLIQLMGK